MAVVKSHFLTGQLPEFARNPLAYLEAFARGTGDRAPLHLGYTHALLLRHPDDIAEVLITRAHDFRKSATTRRLRSMMGMGLLTSDGDAWMQRRRVAQPAFHRERMAGYADTIVALTDEMLERWRADDVREVHAENMALTLRIATTTLFGADVADDLIEVARTIDVTRDHFESRFFSLMYVIPDWVPTPDNRRYARAIRALERIVYRIIDQRRSGSSRGHDLLDMFIEAGMTNRELRDEVMTMFLAGHETTAITLSWAYYLLARFPATQTRLAREVAEVVASRRPFFSDIAQLQYTEAVVNETMRLYPPAWLIGRDAIREVELGSTRVPKGMTVFASPWLTHRDARFFEDPETFSPERWLGGLAGRLPRCAYFPFGAGQRMCIGASFAMLEAVLVLARVFQRYRLELEPDQRVVPRAVVTVRPRDGIKMRLLRAGSR